jgi:RNA polymerase sigma factor (sigma-70 family)
MESAEWAGRNERFESVVVPHMKDIRRLARSLTNSGADAEDVLQEATVRLLRFIHGYRGGDSRSWVLRVARNTAISWLRTNRRRNHVGFGCLPGESPLPQWAPEAEADEREDLFAIEARRREGEALRRAIGTLTREQREIIVLRDLNGFQYTEIAAVLSIPLGTVMSRLSRARAVLQDRLQRADDSPAMMAACPMRHCSLHRPSLQHRIWRA